jgi:hypothetical protein
LRHPDATAETIAEILHSAGYTPATVVAVLRAEQTDAAEMAQLLPTIGVPMDAAIRVLHEHWDLPRHQAAEQLNATAPEMRAAGCSPAEIMAVRPREVLRTLPDDPELWASAALTMVDGGHPSPVIVSHLVAHAPTTQAFANALVAVVDDPVAGLTTSVRYGAQPAHLATAAEAYSLIPAQAATVLTDAGATTQVTVETIHQLCDHDLDHTLHIAKPVLGLDAPQVSGLLDHTGATMPLTNSPDPTDAHSLLAHLPEPDPATPGLDNDSLLAMLPAPDGPGPQPEVPETTQ